MRIAHIGDLHTASVSLNPLHLFSKRFFGMVNSVLFRKKNLSKEPSQALIQFLQKEHVDLVLFAGDFTTTSLKQEFIEAQKWLNKISQAWICVPGNHDNYTKKNDRKKTFYQFFQNQTPIFGNLKEKKIEAHKISQHSWVVCLDTTVATKITSSRGLFSQAMEEELKHCLQQIPKDDKIILLNHYPFFFHEELYRTLERGESLERLIRQNQNIVLYLHGHTHRNCVADLREDGLPIILDSGSCSHLKHGSWNLLDIQDNKCTISTYLWNGNWNKARESEFIWKM